MKNIYKYIEALPQSLIKTIVFILLISIISPVVSASSYYNTSSNTIILSIGTNSLQSIYKDINNPSVLEYNSATNTYILNAKIESIGISSLTINDTTLLINNSADNTESEEYHIQVGSSLNISNAAIKSNQGKRFNIRAGGKGGNTFTIDINNVIIDGGWIYLNSFIWWHGVGPYVGDGGHPIRPITITNLTIKNLNLSGTIPYGNEDAAALMISDYMGGDYTLNNIIMENINASGSGRTYTAFITMGGKDNLSLRNIHIYNGTAPNWGAIGWLGAMQNLTMENITIENLLGNAGIATKEGLYNVGKTHIYKNVTIKNISDPYEEAGNSIYTYQNMFVSDYPSGMRFENLVIDGSNGAGGKPNRLFKANNAQRTTLWIFNATLKNAINGFRPRNATYYFTNTITQNIDKMYNNAPFNIQEGSINWYELADIYVIDNNGNPISGATLQITPNVTAPEPNVVDKWFNAKTNIVTGSNGHTPLPSDETGTVAILRTRASSSGTISTYYSYTITASYNGSTNTTIIIPSVSWYRPNPNTYSNTIVITLPLSTQNYSTSGYVIDPNGLGIQGAEIAENVTGRVTYTDPSGRYSLGGLVNGTYNISAQKAGYSQNFKVISISGMNVENTNITLIPDTTSPAGITSLGNITYAQTYISWSWLDPTDADLSAVMIYLNGIFQTNVTKGVQLYNATGLTPDTSYTISTQTVDTSSNVNQTWINHTSGTAPSPTPTPTPTATPTPTPTPTPSPTPTPTPTPTPAPGATYDNRLREASPDSVIGGSTYIDLGHFLGIGRYRDVLWFNLSNYNTTDNITQALLSLYWYFPSNIRNQNTTVEVYRPLPWDQSYVNWNNRTYNTPWINGGGDWFDRTNAAQGNVPYASVTFGANVLADNRYYDFDVTELVRGYVNGTYNNTGFFLKARDENDNYIAFYSSDWSDANQRPMLVINYTAGAGIPVNLSPSITSFSPNNITPTQSVNGTYIFSVTTDQPVNSTWYLDGVDQNHSALDWTHTWSVVGNYNVTYYGSNGNGSVSIIWGVSVNSSTPDTTPPLSITSLQNITYAQNYINWTWTDPSDADFAKVMVYLDGSFVTNVTKGVQFYNATGLTNDTSYTISTHTVDTSGNINQTWMNHTARTAPAPAPSNPDVNLDGSIDIADLVIVGQHFSETTTSPYPRYDVNADGKVNVLDITLVASKI